MVRNPRLDPRDFDRVRELRLNRLVQLRDLPPAVADRVFTQLLYPEHPYGHLPIGTEEALRALTIDDVTAFHRRVLHADERHGDCRRRCVARSPRRTRRRGLRRLGQPGAASTRIWSTSPRSTPPPSPAGRVVTVHRTGAAQSELRMGHIGLARSTPDYHALLVMNMILGGQFVSRINMNLREEKGYTYGARTSFEFRKGPGPFVFQTSVQSDVTAEAVREVLAEIEAIRGDRPVTAAELELGRAALTRGYPRNFETAEQLGRAAVQLALYGLPDDYFTTFVPRVLAHRRARRHARRRGPPRAGAPPDGDRRRSRQGRADTRRPRPRRSVRSRHRLTAGTRPHSPSVQDSIRPGRLEPGVDCSPRIIPMVSARLSLSLVGVVGVMALALAGATIWLLVTQPVTVADAVAQGELSPIARALGAALYEAFQGLLKYL